MNFARKRKKAKRIRQERALLFVYALAVTAALAISIHNNNSVEASAPYDVEVEKIVPEEFSDTEFDVADETLNIDNQLEDITLDTDVETLMIESEDNKDPQTPAQEVVASNARHVNHDVITVAKGDSFIGILTKLGLDYAKATDVYMAYKKVFDARNIKVGQNISITSTVDNVYNELVSVDKVVIEPVSGTRYIVEQGSDGKYEARIEQDDLETSIKSVKGIINGNVSSAMQTAGVPSIVVGNFINIFSFNVDFRRDVCNRLTNLGVVIDESVNNFRGEFRVISKPESKVKVVVIPTNEELVIARDTTRLLGL